MIKLTQLNYKIIFCNYNNKRSAIIYDDNEKRIANIISYNTNTFKIWISTTKFNFNKYESSVSGIEINTYYST